MLFLIIAVAIVRICLFQIRRFIFVIIIVAVFVALANLGHAADRQLSRIIVYWNELDNQCRGSGDTTGACVKRLAVDHILDSYGCKFRYPSGWPELNEYWKCHKGSR